MASPFDFSQMAGIQPVVNNQAPSDLGAVIGGQGATPGQNPEQIKQGWLQYLQTPEVKAGLMQFAASILQPVGPGDTGLSLFGRSVAEGAAATGRATDRATAEAQRQTENIQRQQQIDIQGEGVEVDREGNRIRREGLEVDRGRTQAILAGQDKNLKIARERIQADKEISDATIDGMYQRLQAEIASREEMFGRQADSALLQASVEAAFAGIDPLLFDTTTPEGMAQYNAALDSAFARGMQNYFMLRQVQPYSQNPGMYTDEFVGQARASNPAIAAANLRAMGVPEEIIQRNMPAEPPAAPAGTETPAPAAPAPAPQGQSSVGLTPRGQELVDTVTQQGEQRAGEIRTEVETTQLLKDAVGVLRNGTATPEEKSTAEQTIRNTLPGSVGALSPTQFMALYQSDAGRALLESIYTPEAVQARANSL